MKIYTKTGDKGNTSLIGGTRVSKADSRLEAYGTVDELNSFVGLLRAKTLLPEMDAMLHRIQNDLFNLGAYLATDRTRVTLGKMSSLTEENVRWMEEMIDGLAAGQPAWRGFVLPGGNERVALSHVCRTVTRRLERQMVALLKGDDFDVLCLQYVNRLSDFFFVLSQKIAQIDGCDVFFWGK